jgi:hypothetical protein
MSIVNAVAACNVSRGRMAGYPEVKHWFANACLSGKAIVVVNRRGC